MDALLQQWLLNLAIDFAVPLRLLPPLLEGDDSQAHALNVKSLHGFPIETIVDTLIDLAGRGLIAFHRESAALTASEVLQMSPAVREREISFELTEAGGRAWEVLAQPRWHEMDDGYLEPRYEDGKEADWESREWHCVWCSQNRDRLMAVLGWFAQIEHHLVALDTITWNTYPEYPVNYWKRLSNVHVLTFRGRPTPDDREVWPQRREPKWFTAWRIARSNWYRHPWDLEGWPPGSGSTP